VKVRSLVDHWKKISPSKLGCNLTFWNHRIANTNSCRANSLRGTIPVGNGLATPSRYPRSLQSLSLISRHFPVKQDVVEFRRADPGKVQPSVVIERRSDRFCHCFLCTISSSHLKRVVNLFASEKQEDAFISNNLNTSA
jgi:hypothetical protein